MPWNLTLKPRCALTSLTAAIVVTSLIGPGSAAADQMRGARSETAASSVVVSATSEPTQPDERGAAGLSLTCNVTVDNPHYSAGSGGVIAKVRYDSCVGNTSGVFVFNAYLTKYVPGSMGPYPANATHLGVVRNVSPGSTGTVYVPGQAESGIACNENHNYYGSVSGTLTVGGAPSSFSAQSQTIRPNCP